MSYLNLSFYVFILMFFGVYYCTAPKYRYIVIAIGSYFFYGYTNTKMLLFLMAITLITYIGGIALEKRKRKIVYITFFCGVISILIVFKYTNFIFKNLNVLLNKIQYDKQLADQVNLLLPVGLSFIIFQACTYLGDVYKNNILAEKNIIRYAAFVAFFPTILAGPIQKSRKLLPQLHEPVFNGEQAKKGTILFVWGLFQKIVIANQLLIVVNRIFDDYKNYNSAYYIVAGICFSIYIYADFSSYSDMARGVSKIMGIQIDKNFNNPYLACTTSEFWNRWHISLNSWFLEYVYIPLGGNRKGSFIKYRNVFVVFLVSGLWHGAGWHFLAWGAVNGVFVIIGQIFKPIKKFLYVKMKIDEDTESAKLCKRICVFILITLSWVFFRNGVHVSLYLIKNMILFKPLCFFDENLLSISGSIVSTLITAMSLVIFLLIQLKRQDEGYVYERYSKQTFFSQILPVAMLLCACVFAVCANDSTVSTEFLYFKF